MKNTIAHTRRAILLSAAAAGAGLTLRTARANDYPSRPITIVVPYPPGGTVGAMARLIADRVGPAIKGTFVVENKGGGAGSVGTVSVARAAPDGHTLVLGTQQTHATNTLLVKALPYDPIKDFVPIAQVCALQHLLVTRKGLGPTDLREFVDLARSRPEGLTYGSTGLGSAAHFITELFKREAKIPTLLHVPFRGSAPLAQELLGGRVDFAMASVSSIMAQVEANTVTALGTASETRSPNFKEIPTFAEMGIGGVAADAWFALFAPAGTPKRITDLLSQAVLREFAKEEIKKIIIDQGVVPELRPGDQIAASLPAEIARWTEIAHAAKMVAE